MGGELWARGLSFTRTENGRVSTFSWTRPEALAQLAFFPLCLKEEIFRLPEQFTLHTEVE